MAKTLPRNMTPKDYTRSTSFDCELSCINDKKAVDAKTVTVKPKTRVLSNFDKSRARDDSILRQTDQFENI